MHLERFSNDRRKSNTKVITPTNHNRSKQGDEPIRNPGNYQGGAEDSADFCVRIIQQKVTSHPVEN